MSFILDALRKLEQERHQGAVSGAASGAAAIGRRRSRPWTIGTMVAIAVGSGVVTAAVLRMTAPAGPPDVVESGNDVEPAASSPQAAAATSEPALVEPPAPRAEPSPVVRETVPPMATVDDSTPGEPEPKPDEPAEEESPQNIRLVGHDSPQRGSTAASDAPPAPAEPSGSFPRLVLQGTSVIDGEPVAVISDRRVFEGDQIDGALVIRIGERVVELEFEGRRFTISL